ncbi:MAG: toll/interleukin-1 receptor domain-containing protein [Gammaproteobacteria bacterium]|nr:toll/interleukin-1 receptor domain-containing protein [Gammaproteobacteria bacterium]
MAFLYELALLGSPSKKQIRELEQFVSEAIQPFGLQIGKEIGWAIYPEPFDPNQKRAAAAVFFGGKNAPVEHLDNLLSRSIPILPVISDIKKVNEEIPSVLQHLNCLDYGKDGAKKIASALLGCAELLPRQRRVFLSYRRDEACGAAVQLFDYLSSKCFDVFLDTHAIAPAEDFQTNLWHRLCDSDVLLMLDTPTYFSSRWTSAEFGRALAKGISVLSVQWPNFTPSPRTATVSRLVLADDEIDSGTGSLTNSAITRICSQLETVRSQSLAVRNRNLVSNLRSSIELIGGSVTGVGLNKAVFVKLANGRDIVVYPTVGVPTSTTLHDATKNAPGQSVAVVYDHVGLHPSWQEHLDWLGSHIKSARWVKANEAAWQFADWET